MSKKGGKGEAYRGHALDLWQPPEEAGEPRVCLATTFTFDATFFETECLGRFLEMDCHPQESESIGYLVEREEKLAAATVAVLVDRQHAQSKESLRWDVLPVIVRGAIQHAKLSLLCWANHVRVIIASGNLTEPAYRKNVEVFGALDAGRTASGRLAEIRSCLDFLDRVLDLAAGDEDRAGPRRRARQGLASVRAHIANWPELQERRKRMAVVFGGLGRSVTEQIESFRSPAGPARYVAVLSPFFDREDPQETVGELNRLVAQRGDRTIEFYVPGETLPDGRKRVCIPRAVVDALPARAEKLVFTVPAVQDDEQRPLHAKSLYFGTESWDVALIGSSNFTRAGLSVPGGSTNLEANLLYIVHRDEPEQTLLNQVWPRWDEEPVDLESPTVVWEPAFDEEGEGDVVASLPAAFREALFHPGSDPRLEICLGSGLPKVWSIRIPGGEQILDSVRTASEDHVLAWRGKPVPFVLDVTWQTGAGGTLAATWPVNVSDVRALSPPEELRALTLEEMLAVLGSTRPLHVAVEEVLKKRKQRGHFEDDPSLDPHKRVATETFLLQRTRRVARALERLRERLERPVFSADAFDWRLNGPIGALALAKALQKEARTREEARFFLAELALALRRVRPENAARGGLAEDEIRARLLTCVDEIQGIAATPDGFGESSLDRYVRAAFAEARA